MTTHLSLAALAVTMGLTGQAFGQSPFLELAPLEIRQHAWYAPEAGIGGFAIGARRTVPLFFFLPNVSEDSRIDVLDVRLGVVTTRDPMFGWAIRPLDVFVAKAPWAGGFTLLSYDRTGPLKTEADWLAIRFGPVLRTVGDRVSLDARFLGELSLATVAATGGLFIGQGDHSTGVEGSADFQVVAMLGQSTVLEGRAGIARLSGGADPDRRSWDLVLRLGTQQPLSLTIGGGQLRMGADNYRARTEWLLRAAIRLSPRRQDF